MYRCFIGLDFSPIEAENSIVIFGRRTDQRPILTSTFTLKKSYKRPPHIFSSSAESKIRSIKIHDHMNKPMSNSGSVSFCIPK